MSDAFLDPISTRPIALVLAVVLLIAPQARADDPGTAKAQGPLDGMVFEGRIGPADNPDLSDRLYFEGGEFWSGECTRCGFEPGVYWVRRVDGGVAFRGTLESAERGRFIYEGFVRDGEIEVSINWRHERWYWTIDRELRFVGQLVTGEHPVMTPGDARALAQRSDPRSDRCPS